MNALTSFLLLPERKGDRLTAQVVTRKALTVW